MNSRVFSINRPPRSRDRETTRSVNPTSNSALPSPLRSAVARDSTPEPISRVLVRKRSPNAGATAQPSVGSEGRYSAHARRSSVGSGPQFFGPGAGGGRPPRKRKLKSSTASTSSMDPLSSPSAASAQESGSPPRKSMPRVRTPSVRVTLPSVSTSPRRKCGGASAPCPTTSPMGAALPRATITPVSKNRIALSPPPRFPLAVSLSCPPWHFTATGGAPAGSMAAPGDGLHPNAGVLLAAALFSGFRQRGTPCWTTPDRRPGSGRPAAPNDRGLKILSWPTQVPGLAAESTVGWSLPCDEVYRAMKSTVR